MRSPFLFASALSLTMTSLTAQAVTASAVMDGAVLTAQAGGNPPQLATLASGAPMPTTEIRAVQGTASALAMAILSGRLVTEDTRVTLNLQTTTTVFGPALASVDASALLTIASSSALPVRLDLTTFDVLMGGAAAPTVLVDIGNDGVVDMRGQVNTTISSSLVLTVPTTIRLQVVATGSGPAQQVTTTTTQLAVVPDRPAVTVQQILAPCTALQLLAEETFAPALRLRSVYTPRPNELGALVIGFRPVFAALPIATNCFLLPSPDIVVFGLPVQVDLPTFLGPVGFYTQAVVLSAAGPEASYASRGLFVTL